jgi:hypothetical protein
MVFTFTDMDGKAVYFRSEPLERENDVQAKNNVINISGLDATPASPAAFRVISASFQLATQHGRPMVSFQLPVYDPISRGKFMVG